MASKGREGQPPLVWRRPRVHLMAARQIRPASAGPVRCAARRWALRARARGRHCPPGESCAQLSPAAQEGRGPPVRAHVCARAVCARAFPTRSPLPGGGVPPHHILPPAHHITHHPRPLTRYPSASTICVIRSCVIGRACSARSAGAGADEARGRSGARHAAASVAVGGGRWHQPGHPGGETRGRKRAHQGLLLDLPAQRLELSVTCIHPLRGVSCPLFFGRVGWDAGALRRAGGI